MENRLKTGTTTLGIVTKEGVVLAADMRATAGNFIVNKDVDKVFKVTDYMALTMAGSVSDAQLLTKLIKAELNLRKLRTNREPTVKEAANLLSSMVYKNVRQYVPGISHFLLGGKDNEGFHIYDIYPDGSVTKVDDYVSSGSGSVFAYGVLETLYKKDISLEDAKVLVAKAVNAAIQRDNASGGGINIFTITNQGVSQDVHRVVKVDVTQ